LATARRSPGGKRLDHGLDRAHEPHRQAHEAALRTGVGAHRHEARAREHLGELAYRVLLEVQPRRHRVEVLGHVVGPGEATGRDAHVRAAWRERTVHALELLEGVVRVQVLHELVADDQRDRAVGHRQPEAVGEQEAEVARRRGVGERLARDVYRDHLGHPRRERVGQRRVARSDLQHRTLARQEALHEGDQAREPSRLAARVGGGAALGVQRALAVEPIVDLTVEPAARGLVGGRSWSARPRSSR
jgi:hypothetical protein